jgi:hypothetical protein
LVIDEDQRIYNPLTTCGKADETQRERGISGTEAQAKPSTEKLGKLSSLFAKNDLASRQLMIEG